MPKKITKDADEHDAEDEGDKITENQEEKEEKDKLFDDINSVV